MTWPITPNPAIHDASPQDTTTEDNAVVAQIKMIFSQLPEVILGQVIAFIKKETGIDLSGFLTLLNGLGNAAGIEGDLSDFLSSLQSALAGIDLTSPGSILTAIEGAAVSLTTQIATDLLSLVPLSSIGNVQPNLLLNASFDGSISMNGGSSFVWDGTVDHTGTAGSGSAKVVCNGTNEDLLSNGISVSEGQQLDLSFWYEFTGVSSSGAGHAINLSVAEYLNGASVADVFVCGQSSSGVTSGVSSGGWLQATGTYTVPAGVDTIYVEVGVSSILTAGTVWIDDVEAKKVQLLGQSMVDGLTSALTGLATNIQDIIDKILSALTGTTVTGGLVGAVESGLASLLGLATGANTTANGAMSASSAINTSVSNLITDIETGTQSVLSGINANNIVSGTLNEVISGLSSARDAIAQGLGLTGSGGLTNTAAQNFAANVATVANQAAAAAASANATLAAQQAVTNANNGGGGNHALFDPSGADGAAISSSIMSSTGVTSGDLCIRGSNGYIGMNSALSAPGIAYGILNFTYAGDDQSLILSLGDQGAYDGAGTYGYMHSDSSHTTGAYIKVVNDTITIGSYTRSGGTYAYTPFSGGSVSATVSGNDSVEFRNVGTNWSVLVGGAFVINGLANASVTFGSSRRSAAVSMERKHSLGFFGWGAGNFDSFRLAGIYVSDLVTPTFVGSTAKMIRTATANVTVNNSTVGPIALPSSFFGSVSRASADITANVTNGTFTVSNAGLYEVSFRAKLGTGWTCSTTDISAEYGPCVQVNGTTIEYGRMNTSFLTAASDLIKSGLSMESQFQVYLNAGDVVGIAIVAPANSVLPASSGLVGTADGLQTYFSIGLMNKSLA